MKNKLLPLLFGIVVVVGGCQAEDRSPPRSAQDEVDVDSANEDETLSSDASSDDGPPEDDACGDGLSNKGCVFWAVDLPNVSIAPLLVAPHLQPFAVVAANTSSTVPANVAIYSGDGSTPIDSATVGVGEVVTFVPAAQNIEPGATTISGVAYRIESDVPITAYQFNPLDNTSEVYSNDASLLFPEHVLSKDYTAITGSANIVADDGFNGPIKNTGGFVSVVATEDDTTVTLYPTGALHPGPYKDVVLSRGQVLTGIAAQKGEAGNLSGTRVAADKRVAVFSGSVATSEPTNTTKCCADHVEHQMLPLEAWGSAYLVAPAVGAQVSGDRKSLYRISAAYDGTELEYSPAAPEGAPTTLNAYQTAEILTKTPFIVRSKDPKKSFSVTQFLLSAQYFGKNQPGDPSMIVLPAADQLQPEYVFLVPRGYSKNFATVVRRVGDALELDGKPVVEEFFLVGSYSGVEYEYGHLELTPGHHTIVANNPVGVTVIGYAQTVSYGYPAGSGVNSISEAPAPPVY